MAATSRCMIPARNHHHPLSPLAPVTLPRLPTNTTIHRRCLKPHASLHNHPPIATYATTLAASSPSPPRHFMATRDGIGTSAASRPLHHTLIIVPNSVGSAGDGNPPMPLPSILEIAHLVVSLGLVLAMDKLLKQAFIAASIKFPSALFGMFCVFSVLIFFDTIAPAVATALMNFFEPATLFIQRWLPLFYVPSLVVLPLAVRDVPAASGLKIFLITCVPLNLLPHSF